MLRDNLSFLCFMLVVTLYQNSTTCAESILIFNLETIPKILKQHIIGKWQYKLDIKFKHCFILVVLMA